MSVDTKEKRSSAIGVCLPFMAMLPPPDGDIDDSDRAQVAYLYSGFDYAGDDALGIEWLINARRRGSR